MDVISILVGVFVTAHVPRHHRTRIQWSLTRRGGLAGCNVSLLFLQGQQNGEDYSTGFHAATVRLPIHESINDGKTYHWFKHAHVGVTAGRHAADAVFKMDSDTSVDWGALCQAVRALHDAPDVRYYMGRVNTDKCSPTYATCPDRHCHSFEGDCWTYMSGGFYGLSRAALDDVMAHPYTHEHTVGTEDALTGVWLKHASPDVRAVHRANGDVWCHADAFRERYPVTRVRRSWVDCDK